ncbi:unnamed protein product [Brachionus calyciflorus]|uniref:Osteoclast-stimulating factor 1 n=1 Tax=Brachionus calyciflorus TaxID=104777 RepID=A0A814K671_9BILA|nr:unnamed protein product [Brachionus calyciflorus]
MNKPPIKPPPKPGQVKVFKALYNYNAQRPEELSFREGDLIYVSDMITDKNWWKARVNNRDGFVPSNYIEEQTESLLNPIHDAAKRGNLDFLKECIQNRVGINSLDRAGNTALHWAAYGGHKDCVLALLGVHNIILDVQNKLGDTALHNAAVKNHPDIVEILVDKGAKIDILNNDSKAPLDLAIHSRCKSLLFFQETNNNTENNDYLDEENDSD